MRTPLTLALALCLTPTAGAAEPIRAFFGPRPADDPGGLYVGLISTLESARESIVGAVHEVDMVSVAEKLAEKARAGVDVRLVVEGDWWENEKNTAARLVLQRKGVKVTPETRKSGLMHNKFFVIDNKRVWTGSTNLTETCLLYNPNNNLVIDDSRLAANYRTMFDVYAAGRFGKRAVGKVPLPHPVVEIAGDRVWTYFSPKDDTLAAVAERIDRAERSIDLMCFVFSSQVVGEAVIRAHKRGVRVRVLLDNAFASPGITKRWPFVPYKALTEAGVKCKYDDEDAKLHHKVILIDGRVTVTGSFNFSLNAAETNDENLLILESPQVTKLYAAEFERLWAEFDGDPGTIPTPERGDGDAP